MIDKKDEITLSLGIDHQMVMGFDKLFDERKNPMTCAQSKKH